MTVLHDTVSVTPCELKGNRNGRRFESIDRPPCRGERHAESRREFVHGPERVLGEELDRALREARRRTGRLPTPLGEQELAVAKTVTVITIETVGRRQKHDEPAGAAACVQDSGLAKTA
jgi:hypothetical protein